MGLWAPWQVKPWPGTEIDWTHPITNGLAVCIPMNAGGAIPAQDLVSGTIATNANVTADVAPEGYAQAYNGTTSKTVLAVPQLSGPPKTVLVRFHFNSTSVNQMLVERSNVNAQWELLYLAGTTALTWRGNSASDRVKSTVSLNLGQWYTWGITDTGATSGTPCQFWQDGVPITTTINSLTTPPANANTNLNLGQYDNGTNYFLNGSLSYVYIWTRVLSNDEIVSITENPWQIFIPQGWLLRFAHAAAGGITYFLWPGEMEETLDVLTY